MADHERSPPQPHNDFLSLNGRLSEALPKGYAFKLYHVSTPPEKSEVLYAPPPGERPDRTYCESHFLVASIKTNSRPGEIADVLVFAIEVLIYSTAFSTTLFVSKADSTGYLHLLKLPKGSPSPLKKISSIFLRYLADERKRPGVRTIVSLFARAQDQYLFPGSIENKGKHVLDDRGLVRWWCRVLDPFLEGHDSSKGDLDNATQGYLTVPGLDKYETTQFLPAGRGAVGSGRGWIVGHPLNDLSRHGGSVPPRCLIPHFPDDPKARFLDELDEESASSKGSLQTGEWRSVKSLAQFWEMMAFRQECSAGRMVGFIWIVFPKSPADVANPGDSQTSIKIAQGDTQNNSLKASFTPNTSFSTSAESVPDSSLPGLALEYHQMSQRSQRSVSLKSDSAFKRKKLSGPVIPRQPRIKTKRVSVLVDRPEHTAHYVWPSSSRGQVVLESKDYKRMTELLLRLDFATLDLAKSSSERWTSEVRSGHPGLVGDWGITISGNAEITKNDSAQGAGVTTLNVGLVRKKRKPDVVENGANPLPTEAAVSEAAPKVNVLGAGMVRKKTKS